MARHLGPDETALWSRVAATVRPLHGRSRLTQRPLPRLPPLPEGEGPGVGQADAGRPAIRGARKPTPPPPPRGRDSLPVAAATLDGGWDRRMTKGRLAPDRVLDLHGFTRDHAHGLLASAIEDAALSGARVLLVVTGKGAREGGGVLRAQLPHWLEAPALRPYIAALRPAHPRHGGGGAWYVILRRVR